MSSVDLGHVCFRDVTWLQHFPLTNDTILDYFAQSQFYDRTCNNEVLKMQARYTDNPTALLTQLYRMTGPEYALLPAVSSPPGLFVVVRQHRTSPTQVRLQQAYYVLDGTIYLAPSIYSLINCRITTSLYSLREAVEYGSHHIRYSINKQRYISDAGLKEDRSIVNPAHLRIYADAMARTMAEKQAENGPPQEKQQQLQQIYHHHHPV